MDPCVGSTDDPAPAPATFTDVDCAIGPAETEPAPTFPVPPAPPLVTELKLELRPEQFDTNRSVNVDCYKFILKNQIKNQIIQFQLNQTFFPRPFFRRVINKRSSNKKTYISTAFPLSSIINGPSKMICLRGLTINRSHGCLANKFFKN